MPDFRVAETAAEHPKLRAAGLAAAGLWSMAGAFSMRELTDGWVPAYWVATWPSGKRQAAALVRVGLWHEEDRNGLPGYSYHDWDDYQRSAARIQRERAEARDRMAKTRQGGTQRPPRSGDVRPNTSRTFAATEPERSPNVHDSLSLGPGPGPSRSGPVGGETSGTEREQPRNAPRPRCSEHQNWPADQRVPACGACADARRAAEEHAADTVLAELADRSAWRAAVDACPDCDENGKLELPDGRLVRHHEPSRAAS